MGASRQDSTGSTAMTHNSYVHREDHDTALKIWIHGSSNA